ncbi:MAG TPA: hypothetical protein VIL84_03695 [Devosiaceae bacterium]
MDEFLASLEQSEPPRNLSKPLQALWWLKKGNLLAGPEWDQAHLICQTQEGNVSFDWVHALAHWIEGDFGNSDYWYRMAGQKRTKPSVAQEWQHMVETLLK